MSGEREKLTNMFSKVMAGTVTREEGTMLINYLAKEDSASTVRELAYLMENPPPGVFAKTILHTIGLSRNKVFHDILITGLEHKNEDVSSLAAEELARLKTVEARDALADHLGSEATHVRKVSAAALVQCFSEGVEIVAKSLENQREDLCRETCARTLLGAGKKGMDALLSVMCSGKSGAACPAARAVLNATDRLTGEDIPKVFDALMVAGDNNDVDAILEILKVVSELKGRVRGFDGYVKAFLDSGVSSVRSAAKDTLDALAP